MERILGAQKIAVRKVRLPPNIRKVRLPGYLKKGVTKQQTILRGFYVRNDCYRLDRDSNTTVEYTAGCTFVKGVGR